VRQDRGSFIEFQTDRVPRIKIRFLRHTSSIRKSNSWRITTMKKTSTEIQSTNRDYENKASVQSTFSIFQNLDLFNLKFW